MACSIVQRRISIQSELSIPNIFHDISIDSCLALAWVAMYISAAWNCLLLGPPDTHAMCSGWASGHPQEWHEVNTLMCTAIYSLAILLLYFHAAPCVYTWLFSDGDEMKAYIIQLCM